MTEKNILLLEGFCRLPWMEDQLVNSYLSSCHRLTRLPCYQRDSKTKERSFDLASLKKLEKELASGKFHSIVVVDLVQDLDIFENKIGPILQGFVRGGVSSKCCAVNILSSWPHITEHKGTLAFPCSELPAVTAISKIFETKWIPGEYTRTDWVVYEENRLQVETIFGETITMLEKQQCVALRNVPSSEKCYGLTPAERTKSPPLSLPAAGATTIGGPAQTKGSEAEDFDVCVAIHEYGKGCIAYFGEVDCQAETIKLLTGFVTNRSQANPVDAFARLGTGCLELIRLHKEKGNDNFRNGDILEAVECYGTALAVYGEKAGANGVERQEHVNLFANLAECYLRLCDYGKVVETSTHALELLPDHFKARMRRCKAHVGIARSTKSLRSIELAMSDLLLMTPTTDEERRYVDSLRTQVSAVMVCIKNKKAESFQAGFIRAVTGQQTI